MSLFDSLRAVIRGKTPAQMRLKGRIWRWRRGSVVAGADPTVVFAMPLVSKRRSDNWDEVCANLQRTLDSLHRQSSGRWAVILCGQDAPDGVTLGDNVGFLRFTGSDRYFDKGLKRRAIVRHLLRSRRDEGYLFQFDADDIAHPDLVRHIVEDHNAAGYFIPEGYLWNIATGGVAPLAPRDGLTAFNKICGSSNAVYFDLRHNKASGTVLTEMKAHGAIPARMAYFGLHMQPIPFAAALYVIGHGENMIGRRGKIAGKLGYVERHALSDAESRAVCREFGVATQAPAAPPNVAETFSTKQ
ncbi:MAG: glycosyltransferase family 2 protein [Celeribacter sp.]|jgi:hypothetical protein